MTDNKLKEDLLKAAMTAFCEDYEPAISIKDADEIKSTQDLLYIFNDRGFLFDMRTVIAIMEANFFRKLNLENGIVWLLKRK